MVFIRDSVDGQDYLVELDIMILGYELSQWKYFFVLASLRQSVPLVGRSFGILSNWWNRCRLPCSVSDSKW